jgi:hypothetical protein
MECYARHLNPMFHDRHELILESCSHPKLSLLLSEVNPANHMGGEDLSTYHNMKLMKCTLVD